MFDRILIVCVGNVCRSPMAAALLRQRLARSPDPVVVDSAGVSAPVGAPADPLAVKALQERGLDISSHKAARLTEEVLRQHPLILVMETAQQRWIEDRWPEARGRVHRLGRWGGFDVPDPLGGTEQEFRDCLRLIEVGVDEWCARMGVATRAD